MALTFEQEMDLEQLKQKQKIAYAEFMAELTTREHNEKMMRLEKQLEIAKASSNVKVSDENVL